jgi:hypothetical protein
MIQLSIVVPLDGTQNDFEQTLVSVLENRPQSCEVIVPCRAGYEDPYDLSDEVHFVRAESTASVIDLLNVGLRASEGRIVHWLLCGLIARANWTAGPVRLLENGSIAAAAPIIWRSGNDRILSAGVDYTIAGNRRLVGHGRKRRKSEGRSFQAMGPMLLAGFCRREVIASMNGFCAWVGPQLADADLAARFRASNRRCVVDSTSQLVCHRQLTDSEPFHMGRMAERLFWKNLRTWGTFRSIACHAIYLSCSAMVRLPRFSVVSRLAGRIAGFCDVMLGRSPQVTSGGADQAQTILRMPQNAIRRKAA